jgi:hypothetical protein
VEVPSCDADDVRALGLPPSKQEDKWLELGLDDLQNA